MAEIVSLQGTAEVQRARRGPWQPAALGDVLCIGDSLRTAALSRAGLELADRSILRVDQSTMLSLAEDVEERSLLEVFIGIVHFLSQQPRALAVDTPFITAGAEGTEFLVEVSEQSARIVMIEGVVRAANREGEVRVVAGEAASARAGEAPRREIVVDARDAVQWAIYYPPILAELAGGGRTPRPLPRALARAAARVAANDYAGALQALDDVPPAERDARYFAFRAGVLLNVGRVEEARAAIDQALALAPDAGEALAQRSIIATAQNQRALALADARRAVELSPDSAPARIALSYALQANLELDEAHAILREAVERTPEDALAWARLAEVELMLGRLGAAEEAAGQAAALAPDLARTQMVRGFAELARINPDEARAAFERAIALESASPLPRLGLGLARIRKGDLAEGRREIEIAASLDPGDALVRSYLGKAYFEERRGEDAAEELQLAKALDPDDPTPWFYDAIRKQTENRPVEALRDLETSIRLNDNRAPFRSRLLLDRDLAVRNVSLARIYDDLGFDQLALVEASSSLSRDPANWSAHRFLADAYARLPRHEIARVSELLQAQLLQPININPVQPSAQFFDLNIVQGLGPAEASLNEFHPLFERDDVNLTATAFIGNNDTYGDELIGSALWRNLSVAAGQLHSDTEGFRNNFDVKNDIYTAFVQYALQPNLNLQVEFRTRNTEQGDITLNFDPRYFERMRREQINQDILRVGGNINTASFGSFLFSSFYTDLKHEVDFFELARLVDRQEGYLIELQNILPAPGTNLITGGGLYRIDEDLDFSSPAGFFEGPDAIEQNNLYIYSQINPLANIELTLGLSFDDFRRPPFEQEVFNPKLGLRIAPLDQLQVRFAALRSLTRARSLNQTLEPTMVAGFNQFFDDFPGTTAWQLGAGVDYQLSSSVFLGAEYVRRWLKGPVFILGDSERLVEQDEHVAQTYVYWTISNQLAARVGLQYEQFEQEGGDFPPFSREVRTWVVPLGVAWFHPSGFFSEVTAHLVGQEVEAHLESGFPQGDDEFFVVDASIGVRLPNRRGVVSLEAQNVFNSDFNFQDVNFRTEETVQPRFVPDQVVLARLTLSFEF